MTFAEIKTLFEQHCKDNDVCPHCTCVEVDVSEWTTKVDITGESVVRITTKYED